MPNVDLGTLLAKLRAAWPANTQLRSALATALEAYAAVVEEFQHDGSLPGVSWVQAGCARVWHH